MELNWKNAGGHLPEGWTIVPLRDFLINEKSVSVGVMYPGEHHENGIPLIKVGDVNNGKITGIPTSKISPEVDEEYKRTRLNGDELLITLVGNPGEIVIVEPHMKGWNAARALAVLRLKDPNVRKWLNLVLNSKPIKHIIDSRLNTTVQKTLNLKDVKELPIPVPHGGISEASYRHYYDLDDKITLNRQINQTLERMAQALFKSWFVDFDPVIDNALDAGFFEQDLAFPDELLRRAEARRAVREHGAYLEKSKPLPDAIRQQFPAAFEECAEPSLGLGGWVPQGWMVQTCEEVSKKIGMGPFGSNIKTSTFVGHGVPIINGKQLSGFILDDEFSNFITPEHAVKLSSSMVCAGDIVLTHRGTIGQVSIIPKTGNFDKYIVSQSQFFLRPDTKKLGKNYLLLFLRSAAGQQSLLSNSAQVGVPAIARPSSHLKQLKLIVPTDFVQEKFETLTDGYINSICLRKSALKTLAKLRDTLLPKLISGELRLDNIEAGFAKEGVA